MPPPAASLPAASVEHRITSRLFEGFDAWWQGPAAVGLALGLVVFAVWLYRRDAGDLPPPVRRLLAVLRLGAIAAVLAACLDIERTAEHEIVLPSRVAVLLDSSASMSLPAAGGDEADSRSELAVALLEEGILAALAPRHEVSIWRFDADAEPLTVLPPRSPPPTAAGTAGSSLTPPGPEPQRPPATGSPGGETPDDWRTAVVPRGFETRLGEALTAAVDREPEAVLAGVIVLTDGGNNAGIDPLAAAARLAEAGVRVETVGLGSEVLPANLRVADLVVPARVFPGDAFAVTAYLQAQGLQGQSVAVELLEQSADDPGDGTGRVIDTVAVTLAADGELVSVRFDVPGLPVPGARMLAVRARSPVADRSPADDVQTAGIEVVDLVTRVLLMAGGPGREYQFMRNVLHRDASFEVDVLLGTAAPGISQDARRILDGFPASDEALAVYDAVVAIDYDWRLLEPPGWSRLERWVAKESGGLLLTSGGVHMDAWLSDPRATSLRGLFPVELRRPGQLTLGGLAGEGEPMPLEFTADGREAEFLWLAAGSESSRVVWAEFPGVYACFPADVAKPGATVYARVAPAGAAAGEPRRIALAGQPYGSGSVFYAGSSELWRLRMIDDASYERLVAQLVRHVSQGRLMRGGQRARLLVDRDRHPVGGTVRVRLTLTDESLLEAATARPPACRAIGPDGMVVPIRLRPDAGRPGTLEGTFVAAGEGNWRIEAEPPGGPTDEPLVRRIQVQLPDRELTRPRLDGPLLRQIADRTGGGVRFPANGWSPADVAELAAAFPDRSRREYETGAGDADFKRRLNAALLAAGCGCLCLEWIVRRSAKLA